MLGLNRTDLPGPLMDVGVFLALLGLGLSLETAQFGSFLAAALLTFRLKAGSQRDATTPLLGRVVLRAAGVGLAALFLRGGVLLSLVRLLSVPPAVAMLVAAPLAAAVLAAGSALFVFPAERGIPVGDPVWPKLVLGLIAYALLLKLSYLGLAEVLHEEAYYWNYGQHPALGYLDHPPMVGWVIWLFTSWLGDSEFAVRLGAFLAWFVGAHYCHALTKRLFGAATALSATLLYALLPVYFSLGLVVIPDSFLVVCWAGALYYLYLFLVEDRASAWWGVGLCIGLGMLSKYTIVLLAAAALAFVVTDREARRWLRRRELYWAIGLAAALFLPVLLWNASHDWASFGFQSTRRARGSFDFDLPDIIGAVALLITPTGLLALWPIFRSRRPFVSEGTGTPADRARRAYRLLLLLTALPAAVFVAFSLFRNTKLNWTGPIWLGVLPYMAQLMSPASERFRTRLPVFGRRPWLTTALVLVLLYGGLLYYVTLGFPGVPYPVNALGQGWPEISRKIEALADGIEADTGQRPLVVGMDQDRINSWLAFYRGRTDPDPETGRTHSGAAETSGRHLFNKHSGMYAFWFPPEEAVGRTLILVGKKAKDLTHSRVESRITSGGPVEEVTAEHHGWLVRRNYYRVVEGYRGP